MALSVIQTAHNIGAGGSPGTVTFTATGQNNLVVFCVGANNGTGTITGIGDDKGNTYQKDTALLGATDTEIWSGVQTIAGATKGTMSFSVAVGIQMMVFEISGAAASLYVDGTSAGTGSGGTLSGTALNTTNANDIIIAGGIINVVNSPWTAGANYTLGGTAGATGASEYRILSGTSSETALLLGTNTTGTFTYGMVAYKALPPVGVGPSAHSAVFGLLGFPS